MSTLRVDNVTDLGDDPVVTAGVVAGGALPAGSILQVVSVTKTDSFTTSSSSFVDITGLSATITPSSASSKILVSSFGVIGNTDINGVVNVRYTRNGSAVFVGDAAGSRTQAAWGERIQGENFQTNAGSPMFLDSPATTSAVTYKVQLNQTNGGTSTWGRNGPDSNAVAGSRFSSSLTLIEVAG